MAHEDTQDDPADGTTDQGHQPAKAVGHGGNRQGEEDARKAWRGLRWEGDSGHGDDPSGKEVIFPWLHG